jgi:hypothetical protein
MSKSLTTTAAIIALSLGLVLAAKLPSVFATEQRGARKLSVPNTLVRCCFTGTIALVLPGP